jgi:flagellar biosynthesis protein
MIEENPTKAVTLKYDPTLPAPFVSARSSGELARKMVNIAEESGVPVLRLDKLADELFLLDPGTLIPEYLYLIVAEILSFIYSVQESQ